MTFIPQTGSVAPRFRVTGDPIGRPLNMTVDEGGRFWWSDVGTRALASFDPTAADPVATVRSTALPDGSMPIQPRSGPGDRIWFTDAGRNGIGRLEASRPDPAATLEFFTAPEMPPLLGLSPLGPDDRFWFTSREAGILGCFDPAQDDPVAGALIIDRPELSGLTGVFPGPDRHMWMYRIDLGADDWTHAIETVCGPESVSAPDGLCPGPDDHLWFCNAGNGAIGRLDASAPKPAETIQFFTAPGLTTPFDLQAVGRFMVFTDRDGAVGRILATDA